MPTINFSAIRQIIGVTDIGRKSLIVFGCVTLETDVNHCAGSVPVAKDKLSHLHIGSANYTEHCLRTHHGGLTGPGDVRFKQVSIHLSLTGSRE